MENNGTGIIYPTVEINGTEYTLRFTRGALLYRLSKRGVGTAELNIPSRSFGALVDILHAVMEPRFLGSTEQLAELMEQEMAKSPEVIRRYRAAVDEALGKVFPPTPQPLVAADKPTITQ